MKSWPLRDDGLELGMSSFTERGEARRIFSHEYYWRGDE
jgi:hypothetical protein